MFMLTGYANYLKEKNTHIQTGLEYRCESSFILHRCSFSTLWSLPMLSTAHHIRTALLICPLFYFCFVASCKPFLIHMSHCGKAPVVTALLGVSWPHFQSPQAPPSHVTANMIRSLKSVRILQLSSEKCVVLGDPLHN